MQYLTVFFFFKISMRIITKIRNPLSSPSTVNCSKTPLPSRGRAELKRVKAPTSPTKRMFGLEPTKTSRSLDIKAESLTKQPPGAPCWRTLLGQKITELIFSIQNTDGLVSLFTVQSPDKNKARKTHTTATHTLYRS